MTITLQLSTEEAEALRRTAEAAGVDVDAVLHQLIALLAPEAAKNAPAHRGPSAADGAAEEEAAEDAERRREQEEMQANIRRWHAEQRSSASAPSG